MVPVDQPGYVVQPIPQQASYGTSAGTFCMNEVWAIPLDKCHQESYTLIPPMSQHTINDHSQYTVYW